MRLINAHTLELETFTDEETRPRYAILSHRWSEDGESTLQDFQSTNSHAMEGFRKIAAFCSLVVNYSPRFGVGQVDWCWVDTCCIDKTSSAELSEAVNRMARWYAKSAYCIAYLADVTRTSAQQSTLETPHGRPSAWFSRGWTLQELVFPSKLFFCDAAWCLIPGVDKRTEAGSARLSAITHIPVDCLHDSWNVRRHCVANKMSWAARRETTRVEDEAYCLLGLFGITMPLLYGEGTRAFFRLQKEIIDRYEDETIFAWLDMDPMLAQQPSARPVAMPILAPHPSWFVYKKRISTEPRLLDRRPPYKLTNRGLEIEATAFSLDPCPYTLDNLSRKQSHLPLGEELIIIQMNCCANFAGLRNGNMQDPNIWHAWTIALRQIETPDHAPVYARVLCWATGNPLKTHLQNVMRRHPGIHVSWRERQQYHIVATTEQINSVAPRPGVYVRYSAVAEVRTLDDTYSGLLTTP